MQVLRLNEIFGDLRKVIIGVVHLKPLPGAPSWNGDLNDVIESALRDARSLEDGGVHGILVENFGDFPYKIRVRDPETLAAFTLVSREVVREVSIPVGLNLLRNSAIEAASIAYVVGAKFIRVNVFSEPMITDSGIIQPAAPVLLRHISKLNARLGILADVNVKHAYPITRRPIEDVVIDAFRRGNASCVVLTGRRTGVPPSKNVLERISKLEEGPVLIGSGLAISNIDLLKLANGAIVGTFFKEHGDIRNPIDKERVSRFMEAVRSVSLP
ncbi:MAG: BtpA/SgcQ family protein [Candidatus Korarchaeota archaeon]|nr:BtpA/SgcQ family protein [Thermoproteota archaeon]